MSNFFNSSQNMFNCTLFTKIKSSSLIWRRGEILNGCKNDLKCTKLFIAIRCYREITETPSNPCSKTSFLRFYYSTNIWSIYSINLFNAVSTLMTFANICNLSKIIGKLKLNLKWINLTLYFVIPSLILSNVNLMEFECV